ncbi:MAG: hypothetical protein WC071_13035, partial [Victivallaceae bacterium]
MKSFLIIFLNILMLSGIAEVASASDTSAQLDPGGVSIDFSKIKQEEDTLTGPNLIVNGSFEDVNAQGQPVKGAWGRSWFVHSGTKEAKELQKNADSIVITTTATDDPADGKRCAKFITPAKVNEMRPDSQNGQPMLSSGFSALISLPKTHASGKYLLTFMLRGVSEKVPGVNQFTVVANLSTGKQLMKRFVMTDKWTKLTYPIMVPSNITSIRLDLKLYGCGEAYVDDVQLRKVQEPAGVTVRLFPQSFIDNTYCLASGVPGIIGFAFCNEAGVKINTPELYLKLPAAVTLIDARVPLKIASREQLTENGMKYILYKIELVNYGKEIQRNQYFTWRLPTFMLKTAVEPGADFTAEYKYVDGTYATSWQPFKLQIIPAAAKSPTPKHFLSAAMLAHEADFNTPDAAREFVDFYKNCGFNSIHGFFVPAVNEELKKAGIKRYAQEYYLCNGYRIGEEKKPESVLFKLVDGSSLTKPKEAICPVEVYTQGKYFQDAVIPLIKNSLVAKDSYDNIMSNWEPFKYDFKGCFCDRCKAEFIKYSGLSSVEVDKVWPKDVTTKYRDTWIKFRSWQHGQVVKTLEDTTVAIGKEAGKDAHFIPEIAWSHMTEGGRDEAAQYDSRDYMNNLKFIEPWGPYIFFDMTTPYIYNTGLHLITYCAGET